MHSFDISSMIIFDILFSCAETEKLASFHETLNAEEPTQIPLLFFFLSKFDDTKLESRIVVSCL